MDTGACDFEMDIDTTKELTKAGNRVHEWYPEALKLVSKDDLSIEGRLLIWIDNGNSWTDSNQYKPDWADLMSRYPELANGGRILGDGSLRLRGR